jgi:hypothetical protein
MKGILCYTGQLTRNYGDAKPFICRNHRQETPSLGTMETTAAFLLAYQSHRAQESQAQVHKELVTGTKSSVIGMVQGSRGSQTLWL